jgi:hypothetical protein
MPRHASRRKLITSLIVQRNGLLIALRKPEIPER